jgi:hypothetical protein
MNFSDYFKTGFHNTIKFISTAGLSYRGTVVYITPNTVVDTWPVGEFTSADYEVAIEYGVNDVEHLKILLTARVGQASIQIYGRSNLGKDLVRFTAVVDNSKVSLIANPLYQSDGVTLLTGIKLIYRANYAERIEPVKIPTVNGESSSAGGEDGILLNLKNTNLPDGFLNINDDGGIVVSNIKTITATAQTNLAAGYIMDTLNVQNTDNSITVTTNNTTKTVNLALTATPYLTVTNSIVINSSVGNTIDNINIGQTTPAAGRFLQLTALNVVTFTPTNANVIISPTGTGTFTSSPTVTGTINNVIIGQTTPAAGRFTSLTLDNNSSNNNQLLRTSEYRAVALQGAI